VSAVITLIAEVGGYWVLEGNNGAPANYTYHFMDDVLGYFSTCSPQRCC